MKLRYARDLVFVWARGNTLVAHSSTGDMETPLFCLAGVFLTILLDKYLSLYYLVVTGLKQMLASFRDVAYEKSFEKVGLFHVWEPDTCCSTLILCISCTLHRQHYCEPICCCPSSLMLVLCLTSWLTLLLPKLLNEKYQLQYTRSPKHSLVNYSKAENQPKETLTLENWTGRNGGCYLLKLKFRLWRLDLGLHTLRFSTTLGSWLALC